MILLWKGTSDPLFKRQGGNAPTTSPLSGIPGNDSLTVCIRYSRPDTPICLIVIVSSNYFSYNYAYHSLGTIDLALSLSNID